MSWIITRNNTNEPYEATVKRARLHDINQSRISASKSLAWWVISFQNGRSSLRIRTEPVGKHPISDKAVPTGPERTVHNQPGGKFDKLSLGSNRLYSDRKRWRIARKSTKIRPTGLFRPIPTEPLRTYTSQFQKALLTPAKTSSQITFFPSKTVDNNPTLSPALDYTHQLTKTMWEPIQPLTKKSTEDLREN